MAVGGVVEPVLQLAVQVPLTGLLAQVDGQVAWVGVPFAGAVVHTAADAGRAHMHAGQGDNTGVWVGISCLSAG